jgi:hypothetical protein
VNGNSIEFFGTIPANAHAICVLSVLDNAGKVIRHTEDVISAMSKDLGGVVMAAPDGMLQLTVPAGALPEDALVEVSTQIPANIPELAGTQNTAAQFSQLEVVYGPLSITATGRNGVLEGVNGSAANLLSAATMRFQRTAAEMKPLDAGRVDRAERYDAEHHTWSSLDKSAASLAGIADVQGRTISAALTTFGIYRISAIPKPGDGVTELTAYPSPLRAGSQNATIAYLMGDDADCDVVIYDVLGNLVRHFRFSAGSNGGTLVNMILWDGRNGAGDVVANGAYIIQVTSNGHRTRTKIGVAK